MGVSNSGCVSIASITVGSGSTRFIACSKTRGRTPLAAASTRSSRTQAAKSETGSGCAGSASSVRRSAESIPLFDHAAQEVLEALARLVREAGSDRDRGDAVEPEIAEVGTHLAPRRERPALAPEVQAQGTHAALARLAGLVLVAEHEAPARDDRLAHGVEHLA